MSIVIRRTSMSQIWNTKSKRIGLIVLGTLLLLVVSFYGFLTIVFPTSQPPKENKLVETFYAHRVAFEHMRDMLREDEQLFQLANWGVETINSGPHRVEPGGDFPVDRYNEYLSLLKQTGGISVSRDRGKQPELISIGMWASGWAGDSRHLEICWAEHPPQNQVASLDAYYKNPNRPTSVYRHIDSNWYIWANR